MTLSWPTAVAFCAAGRLLVWPLRVTAKLLINALLGLLGLWVINFIGAGAGLKIAVNPFNAALVGLLGVPGVLVLLCLPILFG